MSAIAMDEPRIFRANGFGVDATLLERRSGRLVVNENVGLGEQFLKGLRTKRVIVVKSDRTLIAIGC